MADVNSHCMVTLRLCRHDKCLSDKQRKRHIMPHSRPTTKSSPTAIAPKVRKFHGIASHCSKLNSRLKSQITTATPMATGISVLSKSPFAPPIGQSMLLGFRGFGLGRFFLFRLGLGWFLLLGFRFHRLLSFGVSVFSVFHFLLRICGSIGFLRCYSCRSRRLPIWLWAWMPFRSCPCLWCRERKLPCQC